MKKLNKKQIDYVDEIIEKRCKSIQSNYEFYLTQYIRLTRENEDLRNRLLRRAIKDYNYWQYPNK